MTATETVPAGADRVFGASLDRAIRYAELLASVGVERGLIGPREPERIWTRHIMNCAVVTELLPQNSRVVDVGSGAGLPGIALALASSTLRVDLVEPLARRVQFLNEVVDELGLTKQVQVLRGRAEEKPVITATGRAEWVTARAVAPLDRLVGWCLPLLVGGGRLIALKGSQAESEAREHESAIRRHGVVSVQIVQCGVGVVDPPATVVVVERSAAPRSSIARPLKGKS